MILPILCGRCFKPLRQVLLPHFLYMLGWCYCLLLFYVVGVIPHDFIVYWIGWCYCQVAGGIATTWWYMADVIARWLMELPLHRGTWMMLLPGGWWNCHCRVVAGRWYGQQADVICQVNLLTLVLRCSIEPHPKCVADGICQYFYSGMDHWPWYIGLLWWFSWGPGPLSPLFQNFLYWCYCHNISHVPLCSGNSISHLAITSAMYHHVVAIPPATWQ